MNFSNVFILDNIKLVRSRLKLLLNSENSNVIEASNSNEFFDAFFQNKCNGDLIIMDIELESEDGIQVIKKIRNTNKDIPIIILTANTNRVILVKAIFEGATDYISKPFDDLKVKNKVNEILGSYNGLENINHKIYKFIVNNKKELARKILSRHFLYQPELKLEDINDNYKKCLDDISYHLIYLAEAINLDNVELYDDYNIWEKSVKWSNIIMKDNEINLNCIKDILYSQLSDKMNTIVNCFINSAIKNLISPLTSSKTFIDKNNAYYNILVEYFELILKMQRVKASKFIMDEVEKGVPIKDIYVYIFEPCLKEVGRLWQINKITIAQEHYFIATIQIAMAPVYLKIFQSNKNGLKFVAACVGDENHDIGIKMVADLLDLDGWDTYYLGSSVPQRDLMSFIMDVKPDVLGISVTMTYYVHKVINLIDRIRNVKELKDTKILVGGYPFNVDKNLWKQVGADLYAPDAIETCTLLASTFKLP